MRRTKPDQELQNISPGETEMNLLYLHPCYVLKGKGREEIKPLFFLKLTSSFSMAWFEE
jgi:hypothetical protein